MSEEAGIAEVAPVASHEQAAEKVVENQEVELNEDGTPKEPEKVEEKPQETPEQREKRIVRGLERQRQRAANWRAKAEMFEQQILQRQNLTKPADSADYQGQDDDSQPLSLTKAELKKLIDDRANEIAPTIAKQRASDEQIRSAAQSLQKSLGDDFQEVTDELSEIFSRDKQLALLRAEKSDDIARYLADADNADEAQRLNDLDEFQFGLAVAKLQSKLAEKSAKPKPSNAPPPIESLRGRGSTTKNPANMTDKEFADWRRSQIRARGNG